MTRDVLKKFFTYSLGTVLQSALSFLLLPLYLRYFSPSDYGVLAVLTVFMGLLSLCTSAGVTNGMIRLYYEVEGEKRRRLVGTTWMWYLFVAVVGATILFTQAPLLSQMLLHTADHADALRLLSAVFFFTTLKTVPFYVFRLEKQAGLYVGFSIFSFLTDFTLKLFLIISLHRGILGYLESSAAASLVTLGLMLPFVARYVRGALDRPFLTQVLRLGAPYIVSGLAMWTLDVSDRLLLARFSGEAAVGIYSLAYTLANIFSIVLATPVSLLMDPFFFAFAAERPMEDTKRLLRRSLIYFMLAGGAVYLALSLGSEDLLRLFTTHLGARKEYLPAMQLVPILGLAPFLYFLSTQASLAGLLVKKPETISLVCLAAAGVNLGLNLFVIPRFGALGAALTTLFAYFLLAILVYGWMEKIVPVCYNWKAMTRGAICVVLAFFVSSQIRLESPLASLFVRVATGEAVFFLLTGFVIGILTPEERRSVLVYLHIITPERTTDKN